MTTHTDTTESRAHFVTAALPSHRSRKQGSDKPMWSDGIHFVRPAAARDRHAMRFVVGAHKVTGSKTKRHAPTLDAAIEVASLATAHWLKDRPADRHYLVAKAETLPEASSVVVLQSWSSIRFDCTFANPVAQVWKCMRQVGEMQPIGRPKKGTNGGRGAAPTQADLPHMLGDCAVLRGDDPIRNIDGTIRVFGEWDAEEFALNLYADEPEENTISWVMPNIKVAALINTEVHFDPEGLGSKRKPFVIWLPAYGRPVYEDTTRQTHSREGLPISAIKATNAQKGIELEAARSRNRVEDRQPSFEERPLRFRSIANAIAEAERRERMLRGEVVR